jgi:hypothetical protein
MAAGSGKKPGACILFIYFLFIFIYNRLMAAGGESKHGAFISLCVCHVHAYAFAYVSVCI